MRNLLLPKPIAAGIVGLGLALTTAGLASGQAPTDPAGTTPGVTTGTTTGTNAGTNAGTDTGMATTQELADDGFDMGWLGLLGLAGLAGLLRKNNPTVHRTDDTTTRRTT